MTMDGAPISSPQNSTIVAAVGCTSTPFPSTPLRAPSGLRRSLLCSASSCVALRLPACPPPSAIPAAVILTGPVGNSLLPTNDIPLHGYSTCNSVCCLRSDRFESLFGTDAGVTSWRPDIVARLRREARHLTRPATHPHNGRLQPHPYGGEADPPSLQAHHHGDPRRVEAQHRLRVQDHCRAGQHPRLSSWQGSTADHRSARRQGCCAAGGRR